MGREKLKLHNYIGRSVLTLIVSSLLTIGLWWFPLYQFSLDYAVSLLLTILTAYVIIETNNAFQLIRVRSYMISSIWLFGMATMGMFHTFHPAIFATFCMAVSYYLLFNAYQQPLSIVNIFHTFLMLSLGCLAYAPLLLTIPFFLWHLLTFMRALSLRSFSAAFVGFILPFWFWLGWILWQEDCGSFIEWKNGLLLTIKSCAFWNVMHNTESAMLTEGGYGDMPLKDLISDTFALILLSFLTALTSIYYIFNSYDDKIRTRMIFYIYVFQSIFFFGFAVLSALTFFLSGGKAGEDGFACLPLLLLNTAPLAAHYSTFRTTWTSLIIFSLLFILFIGLAMLSLWPESVDFMINFVKTSPFIG